MEDFILRYGDTEIKLTQSASLIGVRPRRSGGADVKAAVRRSLDGAGWRDEGVVGGFQVVSIDGAAVDADVALDRIRRDGAVAVGTHVFELPAGRGIYVPTGDIFIQFDSSAPDEERQALIDRYALIVRENRGDNCFVMTVTPDSPNPIKVASGLQAENGVVIAEPDLASRATVKAPLPNDALISEQWHLRNTGYHRNTTVGFLPGADARVVDAWTASRNLGLASVVIAVIDDGFDLAHPDLAGAGKAVHPWDFTRRGPDPRPEGGDWHGTACAGVATAAAGGGSVVGAAPGCTLMPIRWGVDLSDSQIEAWFDYATCRGAWVVSCSWGAANPYFPLSTRASRAIAKCATEGRSGKGCVVVFAAGNENRDVNDPGSGSVDGFAIHPNVIAVAASNSRDARSSYSNFGNEISICAPSSGAGGWGILTTDVTDAVSGQFGYAQGDYAYDFGGTSSACPLVAGIAALVLSINPNLTATEVKQLLQRTARKIGPPTDYRPDGHSRNFGFGCVNAAAAVQAVLPEAQPLVAASLPERPEQAMATRPGRSARTEAA